MIKGINGKSYYNLDSYIDVEGWKKLHPEICKGLVLSKNKKEGNLYVCAGAEKSPHYGFRKFIHYAIQEYNQLPDEHPIKIQGESLGGLNGNRDQFIQYLKLVLGAYDSYQFIFLKTEDGGWESRFDEKAWTPDIEYFPNLKIWLENLVTSNIFTHLGRIIFFKQEHDTVPGIHRDLYQGTDEDYPPHRNEFIHITPDENKGMLLWDSETKKNLYLTSRASWWNDSDWHGASPSPVQTYSLRIDGKFTEEFRKKLSIDHLDQY
jgi:hypothetical protein